MRKHKFRVWDGKNILSSDKIGNFSIDDLSNGFWKESMLFLNYYDKNGLEVYQDDILKISRLNNTNGKVFDNIVIAPNKVTGDFITQVMDFEVIGNIHENSEINILE